MCKVYSECCKNCLLSNDRIVSSKRAKEIIKEVVSQRSHFICHKATIEGKDIVCKSFYDKLGQHSKLIQFAKWLGVLEFVPQTNNEKLPSFVEMNKPKEKEVGNG